MLFLPEQAQTIRFGLEKIDTYLALAKMGCPVFKSAVIMPDDEITLDVIDSIYEYFETDLVTIRYQYLRPCNTPIQGGNRYRLSQQTLASLQSRDTILWILEPIDRLKNDYGINLYFNGNVCSIEMVGKGFDVSDLNRGHTSPHEVITTELPVRKGVYNEWWKFLKFSFNEDEYKHGQNRRLEKLANMGYTVSHNIFSTKYQPLPYGMLEELLSYVSIIYANVRDKNYCVSCSFSDGHYVFWDIQTPSGKKKIYGVK